MPLTTDKQVPEINEDSYQVKENGRLRFFICVKYVFDFLLALVMSIVLLLPMLIISLCIAIDSPGPALFKQTRIGQYGKPFQLYKFRTMDTSAPHEMPTSQFCDADKYITRVGRFLRKTSLDELPQLLNVLKGDMSFVGFRPVCTTECKLNKLREDYGVFVCRPGITGLAQVQGRDNLNYRDKAGIDAEYMRKRSIQLDLYCLLKTIPVTLSQEGVK